MEMDYLPDTLFQGIREARAVAADPGTGQYSSFTSIPSQTATAHVEKITHALGKLGQAGVLDDTDDSILSTGLGGTTTTVYAEKITHVTSKLSQAGLSGESDGFHKNSSSHNSLGTKWIVIIAVVGVVVLALLIGACLFFRRYRRRRAYAVVSRGVDIKGKEKMVDKEDVFNADLHESETEKLTLGGPRIGERNFENGYDNVDTGYEGTGYGAREESHGDNRAKFEA